MFLPFHEGDVDPLRRVTQTKRENFQSAKFMKPRVDVLGRGVERAVDRVPTPNTVYWTPLKGPSSSLNELSLPPNGYRQLTTMDDLEAGLVGG